MSRKKKSTKKYIPKNEFRRNHSPSSNGHPNYIFGETSKKYKSLSLTSNPNDRERKIELKHNPDPNSKDRSFVRVKPITTQKKYFDNDSLDWKFSVEDMGIIRLLIKDYKRRAYRRKKKK